MEFTDIDKKNMKKMYKKYGQKLVSKIIKKQDKLKMSESIRSTMRKMRQKGGSTRDKISTEILSHYYMLPKNDDEKKAFENELNSVTSNSDVYTKFKDIVDGYNKYKDGSQFTDLKNKIGEKAVKYFVETIEKIEKKLKQKIRIDKLTDFLKIPKNDFGEPNGIYPEFMEYIKELPADKKFPKNTQYDINKIKKHLLNSGILVEFLKKKKGLDIENEDVIGNIGNFQSNLQKLYLRLKKSLDEKTLLGYSKNPGLYQRYPIQNDQTIYQENPDSEENLSLKYNPNFQPMQQLPVAIQQPVAVQPVAVHPVAVQPVAVQR